MTHNKRFINSDHLDSILEGSFEMRGRAVEVAVIENSALFGGDDLQITVLGTYPSHVVVMNEDGEVFRAEYQAGENGVTLGEVETLDIERRSMREVGREVREHADAAVKAILGGDGDVAEHHISALWGYLEQGVRLTPESIEDGLPEDSEEPPWLHAVRENRIGMTAFVGAEAHRGVPRPKFATVIEAEDEVDDDRIRKVVGESFRKLRNTLEELGRGLELARRVDETFELRVEGDAGMAAGDFIEFTAQFCEDLDELVGIAEDAIAVSEDGDLKSLARIHDRIAVRMDDIGLAAAFVEKFARRFQAPQAA